LASGSCASRTQPDGSSTLYGDQGRFQMLGSPTACSFLPGATFLEMKNNNPVSYTGDINTVFACLASNLGTRGCGYQHQLQAFEFALVARGIGNEQQQAEFLRPDANLALIFITDEDDCSAAPNEGLFAARDDLRGESASLRCATRGHACGGKNLTDAPPGYPTLASYTHPFSDCSARADTCPNLTDGDSEGTDTSVPTSCAPFKNVRHLAGELKALKADPEHQLLVAGIFGWPLSDADLATAEYKIAPLPNPNPADPQHPTVFDYWPVCYEPDHVPSAGSADPATGFDATAAGWAAMGGLREAAFLDEFGANGLKFSICQRDLADTMTTIGNRLAGMFGNACFDVGLVDVEPAMAGVQPNCSVFWRFPQPDPSDPNRLVVYQESATSLPECAVGASDGAVAEDCWRIVQDRSRCPTTGQRVEVLRTAAEVVTATTPPPGTKLHVRCRTCADPLAASCDS
jgi:hypothetical protein